MDSETTTLVAEAAARVRNLTGAEDEAEIFGVLHDYSAASRALVGLAECVQCGGEAFSPGGFLGTYYVATCRNCVYVHILTVPGLTGDPSS